MVVSKGPIARLTTFIVHVLIREQKQDSCCSSSGLGLTEDALDNFDPYVFQGKFVVDDLLGGELDSFLGCFQHQKKPHCNLIGKQAFYKHFLAFGFKMISKGSWRPLQHHRKWQQKLPLHSSNLATWDHADKSHWKSMVGRWNSGARPIFRGENMSFRMFQEGGPLIPFFGFDAPVPRGYGCKALHKLAVANQDHGLKVQGDRDAIPEQGRFLCSIEKRARHSKTRPNHLKKTLKKQHGS